MGLCRSRKIKTILLCLTLGVTTLCSTGCFNESSQEFQANPEAVFHRDARVNKILEDYLSDKDYIFSVADKFKTSYKDVMDNLPKGIKETILKSGLKIVTESNMGSVDFKYMPKHNIIFINEDVSNFRETLCKGLGDYLVLTNFCGKVEPNKMNKEIDNCYKKDVPSSKDNSSITSAMLPEVHMSDCIAEYLNLGSKEIEKTNPNTYKFLSEVMERKED